MKIEDELFVERYLNETTVGEEYDDYETIAEFLCDIAGICGGPTCPQYYDCQS